ncbi:uncharacterized protein EI97DRAFT_429549 [Westerdykella ornata]|uniref:DUF7136 domain-containing protein n=1 Tax=Westerdykella ornata TaxID=318751 RepID=A0A6A6K0G8_WESOR|nr:uncharacterized protein EI97DRAFT_429549 [Westerdykella ornata]KAF2281536.1 hypothetical protein EI97DRAFT_429549 [Westerdykella ornata]
MHVFSWTTWWFLAASMVPVGAGASKTSGVVEVDLVFPRNETYAPTPLLPIIFAFQNAELAPSVGFQIRFYAADWKTWDPSKMWTIFTHEYDMRWANFTSREPYFEYDPFKSFRDEGTWLLVWEVTWASCNDTQDRYYRDRPILNTTGGQIIFTTKISGPEIDLIAATNDQNCAENWGVAVDVPDVRDAPSGVEWFPSTTCAVTATTTPKPDPCKVKIDAEIASSISSSMTSAVCNSASTDIPVPCPSKKSAAHQLRIGGWACLLAAFGALGHSLT